MTEVQIVLAFEELGRSMAVRVLRGHFCPDEDTPRMGSTSEARVVLRTQPMRERLPTTELLIKPADLGW
jgi:hypothetical protein